VAPLTVCVTPPTVPVTAPNGPAEGASLTKTSYSSTLATVPPEASAAPLTNGDHRFVGGSQRLLALPEGHTLHLPTVPATEGYEALEPFHPTQLRQDPLLEVARGVVHPIGGTSSVVTRTCMALLLPPATKGGLTLCIPHQ
jgi:hypothetical protein